MSDFFKQLEKTLEVFAPVNPLGVKNAFEEDDDGLSLVDHFKFLVNKSKTFDLNWTTYRLISNFMIGSHYFDDHDWTYRGALDLCFIPLVMRALVIALDYYVVDTNGGGIKPEDAFYIKGAKVIGASIAVLLLGLESCARIVMGTALTILAMGVIGLYGVAKKLVDTVCSVVSTCREGFGKNQSNSDDGFDSDDDGAFSQNLFNK